MPTARPLTPLESLLLADQRPGYPMAFFLHCEVEGPLDTDRLRVALVAAAARHPLLRSRVEGTWWRPRWKTPDRDPTLVVRRIGEASHAPGAEDPWRPIDLRRTSGVRMVAVERGGDRWQVVIQVQHPACDGLAGLEFLGDVWSHYHGAAPAPFRQPGRIARRRAADPPALSGEAGADGPGADAPPPASAPTGPLDAETMRFATFRPATLARGPATAALPSPPALPPLPYLTLALTSDETALVKGRAAAAGVSMNDVVVAAVMRTACAWNAAAGRTAAGVRITMPASLKPAGTRAPACNDMGYAFLDRTAAECRVSADLVRSIAVASRWIQEHRAAEAFLATLGVAARFPPLLWLLTRLPMTLSTAVVSYVGNSGPRMRATVPHDGGQALPGGLRIVAVAGVPPVRPGTRLAVGLVVYDGRLNISVLCDIHAIGTAAPDLLAGMIRAEVLGCADSLALRPEQAVASPFGDDPD